MIYPIFKRSFYTRISKILMQQNVNVYYYYQKNIIRGEIVGSMTAGEELDVNAHANRRGRRGIGRIEGGSVTSK